ncbi:MAG: hypothetical protein SF123_26575 [Chloroflexota bacterium]|nr:hypothetical protein [Chloroflexota bacterium]
MTITQVLEDARSLSHTEQIELIKSLVDLVSKSETASAQRDILEFEGVGAEIWEGMDAQDYVNRLRDEWDQPR